MLYSEFLERTQFSKEELLGLSQGNLVEDAPEQFIRLPAPPMLMLDRVVELERRGPRGRIVGEQDIGLTDSDLAGQYQYTKDIVSVDGSQRGTTVAVPRRRPLRPHPLLALRGPGTGDPAGLGAAGLRRARAGDRGHRGEDVPAAVRRSR